MSDKNTDVSWALELLAPDPTVEPHLFAKYFHEIQCSLFGAGVPALGNALLRRPIYAGIQNLLIGAVIGGAVGHLLRLRENGILATRDAIYRDYIINHPEDFPPPERKKFGEVFYPWLPMR
ncbi:NADH dehydrogenase (ubiquinone) B14.5 B subunit [Cotesia typhae]|uniref:NADH dehydrogenase (ubiquinone) B14.5 B subunit n=1 Tax=Cotesia typhae TaxID=2053667 RepID=UPI003D693F86